MSFFDKFNAEFITFKRDNKKSLKGDSSPKVLDKFLKEKAPELKKELEKAVKNGEKVGFSNLPPQAKTALGGYDAPAKIKRKEEVKGSKVISLSNQNYLFNDGGILDNKRGVLAKLTAGKGYKGKIVIGDAIFRGGDKDAEARGFYVSGDGYRVSSQDDIKKRFNKLSKQNGGLYPVWELYGFFDNKNNYILIINITGYTDSP